MTTEIETLLVFLLPSNYKSCTLIGAMAFAWLVMSLIYWAHPGGPAWGKLGSKTNKPIPGPRGLPHLGSITLMSGLTHHKIAALAQSIPGAKRLMAFSLGETRAVVTCNPEVAKEILTSSVFVDRPMKESAYSLMFNRAIGFAPYGVYWRTLRRISATHLFCPKQIKASGGQRMEISNQIVEMFREHGNIRVRDVLKRASLSSMMCSVFGCKYGVESDEGEIEQVRQLVDEGYDLLSIFNWSDYFPWLLDFDPQKIRLRCSNLVPKVIRFVGQIIMDHRAQNCEADQDFVDVLLSLEGADKIAESDMIAILWEMIFRGTDTVAVLIEWVLARMVLHPDIQSKVHDEIDRVTGMTRGLTEADMPEMVYLTAVMKEVLRLHPPGPLLSWSRLSIIDTKVDGYHVPAGTTAIVNMWAITRDPQVWVNPLEFRPQRFIEVPGSGDFSVFGSDLRLAPFGSGRRICPGKTLGLTTATFWVGALLQELEFRASNANPVDLSEVLRLSCEMANPLMVMVSPRTRPTSQPLKQ